MVSRHAEFLKLDLICGRASVVGDTEVNYITEHGEVSLQMLCIIE